MYVDMFNYEDVNYLIKTGDYNYIRMFVKEDFIGLTHIRELERIKKCDNFFMVNFKCQCVLICDKIELVKLKEEEYEI